MKEQKLLVTMKDIQRHKVLKDLIDKKPEIAGKLKEELFKWMKDTDSTEDMNLTEKSKETLRKLGYME